MKSNTNYTCTPSIVYELNLKNISGRRPSQEPGSVSTGCSALRARGRGGHRSPGELASLARCVRVGEHHIDTVQGDVTAVLDNVR